MNQGMNKIKEMVTDPQALMFEMRKRKKDVIFWIVGIIITLIVFKFISSQDYSFILVLSSLIQTMAFVIVLIKVYNFQNCSGLSVTTLTCYAMLLFSRLCSTVFFNGYLPSDDAGDWFYQLTELVSLVCVIALIYLTKYAFKETSV